MEKIQSLFSKNFNKETVSALYNELVSIHDSCVDEFYILINDYKNKLSDKLLNDPSVSVYLNDPVREQISNSTDQTPIEYVNRTSNEYRILNEILTMNEMISSIEQHIITHCDKYDALFSFFGKSAKEKNTFDEPLTTIINGGSSADWQRFDISYSPSSEIVVTVGIRDLTLITILLIVYIFYDGMSWIVQFYNSMNIHYYLGDEYEKNGPVEILSADTKTVSEEINTSQSLKLINERIFHKFHTLIHILNKHYNLGSIKTEFACLQVFLLFKSITLLHKCDGNAEYIDSSLLLSKEETTCTLIHNGIEPAFTNALLCSKYAFNSRYGWFDLMKFKDYLTFYGNTVKTLALFIHDHEKYNTFYAFGVLYAIRYANISLSNKMLSSCDKVRSSDISIELLADHNRAMLFTVRDPTVSEKLNYYVLEAQDRVLYVSTNENAVNQTSESHDINAQVMNDNSNMIDSFIVYSILTSSINNVDYITYDIDDLKQILEQYKSGIRSPKRSKPSSTVSIDASIQEMSRTIDRQALVLKVIAFMTIVAVVGFIIYSIKNSESLTLHKKINKYDRSLL